MSNIQIGGNEDMNISLRDITQANWMECISLTTNKTGIPTLYEEFVTSNALSIALSKIQNEWIIKAIYNNEQMIGFTMYGFGEVNKFYEILRLMIDYKHQGKGYGKIALKKIINELASLEDCKEIFLSFDPENNIGRHLYEKLNFKDTGRMIDGELLYVLQLDK